MSSLPPKAPPFETSSTVTESRSTPSTEAIWSRSSQTPCPPESTWTPRPPAPPGGPPRRRGARRARLRPRPGHRHRQGRLGLQERLFHPLGLEHLVHHVRRPRQRAVHVAPPVDRTRQHVGGG